MMRGLLLIIALVFASLSMKAQGDKSQQNPGEKASAKLDALVKEHSIKRMYVFFHIHSGGSTSSVAALIEKGAVQPYLVDEYSKFKFEGQFLVCTEESDDNLKLCYYNLEKLIHFTLKPGKEIRIYLQM